MATRTVYTHRMSPEKNEPKAYNNSHALFMYISSQKHFIKHISCITNPRTKIEIENKDKLKTNHENNMKQNPQTNQTNPKQNPHTNQRKPKQTHKKK